MIGYYFFSPYQDFLTLMTGLTLLMVHSHYLLSLSQFSQAKQTWRQLGYTFLNTVNYVKIKT
jgi:hypothetical protein